MAQANRPPKQEPPKEPAEGSRETVDEALKHEAQTEKRRRPRPKDDKPQRDVEPGRPALDD
jgi:hypothetical protein